MHRALQKVLLLLGLLSVQRPLLRRRRMKVSTKSVPVPLLAIRTTKTTS